MPLSDYTRADKNNVVSQNIFLICLDIEIPSVLTGETLTTEHIYLVKDNQNLQWQGQTWYGVDFSIESITDTHLGEVPRVDISISNTNRLIEYYLQLYDLFIKTYGYYPITVKIMVVNTGNTNNGVLRPDPEIEYQFDLKQPRTTDKIATFTLGAPSSYVKRFPSQKMFRNQGRVKKFGDWECGYKVPTFTTLPSTVTYTTTTITPKGSVFAAISPDNSTILIPYTVFNVGLLQYYVAHRDAYNNQKSYYAVLTQKDTAVCAGTTTVNLLDVKHPPIALGSQFSVSRTIPTGNPNSLVPSHLESVVPIGSTTATMHTSQAAETISTRATGTVTINTKVRMGGEGDMTPMGIVSAVNGGDALVIGGVIFLFKRASSSGGAGGDPSVSDTSPPSDSDSDDGPGDPGGPGN